ncbi:MAG: DUF4157 domain-containing protein [Caulobacter sp.]|jgi:hypothetical protein|nr:DUF4157 domain-containing protein [Caulobacter sp.]
MPSVIQGRFAKGVASPAGMSAGGPARLMPPGAVRNGAGGQPLPAGLQAKMESFFRTGFGDVRVHVGPQPQAIGALAFTHGSDLHFAPGQYNPATPHGQALIAHELAHVVQQRAGRVRNPFGSGVALVQDANLEAEADRAGRLAAAHVPVGAQRAVAPSRTGLAAPVQPFMPIGKPATTPQSSAESDVLQPARGRRRAKRKTTVRKSKDNGKGKAVDPKDPVPLPFRYAKTGDGNMGMQSQGVDLLGGPRGEDGAAGKRRRTEDNAGGAGVSLEGAPVKVAVVSRKTYAELPRNSDRILTQQAVMGGLSANKAAKALGYKGSWEWLHMVAYSISPTHTDTLSKASRTSIRKTNRPQQIRENLVLGTAQANTAMLSVETAIKTVMKENPELKLNLVVYATEHEAEADVDGKSYSFLTCSDISYHFNFVKGHSASGAAVLSFDPMDSRMPTTVQHQGAMDYVRKLVRDMVVLDNKLQGPNVSSFKPTKEEKKRKRDDD